MIESLADYKILRGKRPDFLYKYRSLADENLKGFTKDVFINNRLWHCATKDFNDPFEARFDFRLTSEEFNAHDFLFRWKSFSNLDDDDILALMASVEKHHIDPHYEMLARKFQETIQQKTVVLSLCEEYQNILMWSHYADSHRGICIEFDLNAAFEYWRRVLPVQYLHHYPYVLGTEISVSELSAIYLSKSTQWTYEKEWRFINELKTPGLLEFPEESISGVILGLNISQENTALVKEWIKYRKRKPIIRKVFVDNYSYSLGLSELIG
jgi:hypothetical protein